MHGFDNFYFEFTGHPTFSFLNPNSVVLARPGIHYNNKGGGDFLARAHGKLIEFVENQFKKEDINVINTKIMSLVERFPIRIECSSIC